MIKEKVVTMARTRITKKLINNIRKRGYSYVYWEEFDFTAFKDIIVRTKTGHNKTTYADLIIMGDTETSKKTNDPITDEDRYNHVCAWSCAFRTLGLNMATLWGRKPSDFVEMVAKVRDQIDADEIYLYFHNAPYDWVFLEKFFIEKFGEPAAQLNVKPLYPLSIRFANGIIIKDSLMLAQRSLEKWGADMCVTHAKAVGKWDYNKIRDFNTWTPTEDELKYMECDVLCGVECIDATMQALGKNISSIPLTATGIVRTECRNIGRKYKAHDWFKRLSPEDYMEQLIFERVFHGGYTHANRFAASEVFPGEYKTVSPFPECFDFSSSYPFCLCSEKYPAERFYKLDKEVSSEYILKSSEEYAFIFRIEAKGVKLKDPFDPMPVIGYSKCDVSINEIVDNGRVTKCDYMEQWTNEIDFGLIMEHYDIDELHIYDIRCARKDYLPRWFTDYVYGRYEGKCKLKGQDPVLYAIEKAKANSCYGMTAQKPCKPDIKENYTTGEYKEDEEFDGAKEYAKHLNNRNSFLPYFIGIYCTSYAQRNLFELGKCVPENEIWLYSDTDSVYATAFDQDKVKAYNEKCINKLSDNGYKPVHIGDKTYNLGIAEFDGKFMQFKALHSKCYVKRPLVAFGDNFVMGDDLKITVAGVPKRGVKALKNNINSFKPGFIFAGSETGKLQHTHYYVNEIYTDENGNEIGNSIDLTPCDYLVSDINTPDFDTLMKRDINIIDYEKDHI